MDKKKCGKKRRLIPLISALVTSFLVISSGFALGQSYPPEFAGAMFNGNTGDVPVSLCMTRAENIPYSIPDMPPCDVSFWFGNFVGDSSASQLEIYFFISGERIICAGPYEWRNRTFPWHPDVQAYSRLFPEPNMPWVVKFETISVDFSMEFAVYREGAFVFSGHPPVWWIVSEDYQYFEYLLSVSDYNLIGRTNIIMK